MSSRPSQRCARPQGWTTSSPRRKRSASRQASRTLLSDTAGPNGSRLQVGRRRQGRVGYPVRRGGRGGGLSQGEGQRSMGPTGTGPASATARSDRRPLFLLDGNNVAYRAFFALPEDIATSAGFPTNALYGFCLMLIKILARLSSRDGDRRLGFAGEDLQAPGVRGVQGPAQAHARPALASSGPTSPSSAEAFGFVNLAVPGWEADDILATLARQAEAQGRRDRDRHRRPGRSAVGQRAREHHVQHPGHDRGQGLRSRRGGGAVRGAAPPDPRPHRAQGRHLRQHPRRARASGRRRRPSCWRSSAAWRRCWPTPTR